MTTVPRIATLVELTNRLVHHRTSCLLVGEPKTLKFVTQRLIFLWRKDKNQPVFHLGGHAMDPIAHWSIHNHKALVVRQAWTQPTARGLRKWLSTHPDCQCLITMRRNDWNKLTALKRSELAKYIFVCQMKS